MSKPEITLNDRFDLTKSQVLLNGTQALVRLMLMQKARDMAAGLNTAGLVTGYRGSPVGAVDMWMTRAEKHLSAADILFQPGMNEDLAATALWGSQQAELRGEGTHDGVFGLWYGKGPGVDRSGDVLRHANMAGTSQHGGVLLALGDDHTGESSTVLHQSDWAMVDAYMPLLSPAGVQEIIDYGLYGIALSRFAGVWAGLKLMKDTVEVTSVVDGSLDRMKFVTPDFDMPEGGLNIRLIDDRIPQEARMIDYKRVAAEAFANANKIDKRMWGKKGAKIGFVAAGKNWLDLVHALSLLGIDAAEAERLGITTYKIGQTWPLDMRGFNDWADGLDLVVVVEEKRKLIEVQIKEAVFDRRKNLRVYGWRNDRGQELFPTRFALEPIMIAEKIGGILLEEGRNSEGIKAGMSALDAAQKADNAPEIAARLPYFCSGCPHNTSTKIPDGSRAYAGIGCHFMVQWMDRSTIGYTHMGAEGANWIGEAPFSTREHIFQNIGDGTFNHSGIMAIRAAQAAGTTMTYKILFNDAVAMTGGQPNEGGLTAPRIAREVLACGVENLALVYDDKEDINFADFPAGISKHKREDLLQVEENLSKLKGVSVLLYVQTCAAEKRRRRKRGLFPDPDRRLFINSDICEGCGDCGIASNCVSLVPVETELGRKRAIDQSSCNKDFSCVNGFCPSFVSVEGAKLKKTESAVFDIPDLPDPVLPIINGTFNTVVTGVGGTGVVTIGAIMAQAAHMDGMGAGMMEMTGLAQKGGAVLVHLRLANKPEDISAIRVATGECDALIGGELVVSAGAKTLGLTKTGRTGAVVDSHETVTGDFTRQPDFVLPGSQLTLALEARIRERLAMFDATELARILLGDSIFSNMMILGAAWQQGLVPISHDALMQAITLNGQAPDKNIRAFELGRWAMVHPDEAAGFVNAEVVELPKSLQEKIDFRAEHLTTYQSARLAKRYRALVDTVSDPVLKEAVALGYHKVLAYKDEYEVARLLKDSAEKAAEEFDGELKLTYHMSPPIFARKGSDGRPKKRKFGQTAIRMVTWLAPLKRLRGTPFDLFGYSRERRMERDLIRAYEADMKVVLQGFNDQNREAGLALAELPLSIRGFGPVKTENAKAAHVKRDALIKTFRDAKASAEAAQ